MTSFDAQLRTALTQYAREITMTTDMQEAHHNLDARFHRADRRRRIGYSLAAVAAVLLAALALTRLPPGRDDAAPVAPTPTFSSVAITPGISMTLPTWAAGTGTHPGQGQQTLSWVCDHAGCRTWHEITMWAIDSTYLSAKDSHPTQLPPYRKYVAAWRSLDPSFGTVQSIASGKVGGRPATLLTVRFDRSMDPLVPCPWVGASLSDCGAFASTETYRIAIVDQGGGMPVSLLLAGWLTGDENAATYSQEFDHLLRTVRFA